MSNSTIASSFLMRPRPLTLAFSSALSLSFYASPSRPLPLPPSLSLSHSFTIRICVFVSIPWEDAEMLRDAESETKGVDEQWAGPAWLLLATCESFLLKVPQVA